MPVSMGTGAREFPAAVRQITNGDPANQTTFRAPSIDLEKRTNSLRDHSNNLETFVKILLGADTKSVSGVQGKHNSEHTHNGEGSLLIDNQVIYNNGNKQAEVTLEAGGSFTVKANDGTILFEIDNDTKTVTIAAAPV